MSIAQSLGFKLNNRSEVIGSISLFNYRDFATESQKTSVAKEILEAAKKYNVRYHNQQEFYKATKIGASRWM